MRSDGVMLWGNLNQFIQASFPAFQQRMDEFQRHFFKETKGIPVGYPVDELERNLSSFLAKKKVLSSENKQFINQFVQHVQHVQCYLIEHQRDNQKKVALVELQRRQGGAAAGTFSSSLSKVGRERASQLAEDQSFASISPDVVNSLAQAPPSAIQTSRQSSFSSVLSDSPRFFQERRMFDPRKEPRAQRRGGSERQKNQCLIQPLVPMLCQSPQLVEMIAALSTQHVGLYLQTNQQEMWERAATVLGENARLVFSDEFFPEDFAACRSILFSRGIPESALVSLKTLCPEQGNPFDCSSADALDLGGDLKRPSVDSFSFSGEIGDVFGDFQEPASTLSMAPIKLFDDSERFGGEGAALSSGLKSMSTETSLGQLGVID